MPRITEGVRLERRRQLIEVAWRCARRVGYSEVTVDNICAEVSEGAFYGYLSSKPDLLSALLSDFPQRPLRTPLSRSNLIVQLS